jgi:hypothetical protein
LSNVGPHQLARAFDASETVVPGHERLTMTFRLYQRNGSRL